MSRSPSSRSAPDGIVLADKPAGKSSRQVAAGVARALGAAKFGHAGTLDPFATGLLVILLGRACRTQDWFTALPKEYEATARLGWVSTTGDPEGEVRETGIVPVEPLRLPTGSIRQRPPAFSAVHVGGRRAYELARAGEPVETPEREVTVYEFTETGREGSDVRLRISCSSGTYVRSLVSDLGDAYTTELTRLSVGPFANGDADPERVIPIARALTFMPTVELDDEESRRAGHGQMVRPRAEVRPPAWTGPGSGPEEVLMIHDEEAVAIAKKVGEAPETLKPVVGFRG